MSFCKINIISLSVSLCDHNVVFALFNFCVLQLKDNPNIVIAKSDATANDYPPAYEVRG